jgi:hypothetical protein
VIFWGKTLCLNTARRVGSKNIPLMVTHTGLGSRVCPGAEAMKEAIDKAIAVLIEEELV